MMEVSRLTSSTCLRNHFDFSRCSLCLELENEVCVCNEEKL
jgi:hypothetical protein